MNRLMGVAARVAMPFRDPSISVLCYHRVSPDPGAGLSELVASPSRFEEHLDLLEDRFKVVGINEVIDWLDGGGGLPRRAALITLDDGYRDNYTTAYPALRKRGLPATIFLATDHIGSDRGFWWDRAVYAFTRAAASTVDLPFLGRRDLNGVDRREATAKAWIEVAKDVSDVARRDGLRALEVALDVEVPGGAFADMHLSWGQVREMSDNGISFGAHSMTHPILARMSREDAAAEIRGSVERIRAELGIRSTTFAYPNGRKRDFTEEHQRILRDEGVLLAFALSSGPASRRAAARRDPMAIDRVYVDASDTADRLALKLTDLQRVAHWRPTLGRSGAT